MRWPNLATQRRWTGILLGNGASCAIWDRFGYASLYETASSAVVEHPLSVPDKELFDALKTRNFERVLAALRTTELVSKALKKDTTWILERHESVRRALIEAVRIVHVPWERVPKETFRKVRSALLEHDFVYSTNYDLTVISLTERGGVNWVASLEAGVRRERVG